MQSINVKHQLIERNFDKKMFWGAFRNASSERKKNKQ